MFAQGMPWVRCDLRMDSKCSPIWRQKVCLSPLANQAPTLSKYRGVTRGLKSHRGGCCMMLCLALTLEKGRLVSGNGVGATVACAKHVSNLWIRLQAVIPQTAACGNDYRVIGTCLEPPPHTSTLV